MDNDFPKIIFAKFQDLILEIFLPFFNTKVTFLVFLKIKVLLEETIYIYIMFLFLIMPISKNERNPSNFLTKFLILTDSHSKVVLLSNQFLCSHTKK